MTMPQDPDLSQGWPRGIFWQRADAERLADQLDNGHNRITVEQTHDGRWIVVEWE